MITLKKANEKDSKILGKLYYQCWLDTYTSLADEDGFVSLTKEEAVQFFHKIKCRDTIEGWALDELICFCCFGKCVDEDCLPGTGEISQIFVRSDYQLLGNGRKLVHEAIRILRRQDYDRVISWVCTSNTEAIAFYEALGFKWDGSTRPLFKNNTWIREKRYFRDI